MTNLDELRDSLGASRDRLAALLKQCDGAATAEGAEAAERELGAEFALFGEQLDNLDAVAAELRVALDGAAALAGEYENITRRVGARQQFSASRLSWQQFPSGWPEASPAVQAAADEAAKADELKGEPPPVNQPSNWSWLAGLFRPATTS